MTQLRVIQPEALRPEPLFVLSAVPVSFGAGFYDEERDAVDTFRWMGERAELLFAPGSSTRFLEYWTCSEFYDLSQRLEVTDHAGVADESPLVHGWSPRSLEVRPGAGRLALAIDKPFPRDYYPDDSRALAIRVRGVRLHGDPERHAAVRRQQENALLNAREILERRTELRSTPPTLGIDLHGACNVKPPCVYCEWDHSKNLEQEHVDTPFTLETLREWGPFFDNAVSLVNCSIGEPFTMRQIDDLLDTFGNTGKVLEMTTNGQILTERNVQKLVGRPIDLYVSLDAATPLTYSRLRNDTFDKILRNLRRLVEAKGGPGRLPRLHLVFMPMRCNVHELDAFVQLSADLRVDRLVLRPLNYAPASELTADRGGYHFDYQRELLPFDELVKASARAARLCRDLGVTLSDQMDFGGAMRELFEDAYGDDGQREAAANGDTSVHGEVRAMPPSGGSAAAENVAPSPASSDVETSARRSMAHPATSAGAPATPRPSLGDDRLPACSEPWKSLYILRRGVMPCCYGGVPVAPMESYRDTWNSVEVQAIRASLLDGRFHDYCLRSPACPIVRKSDEAGLLPRRQRVLLKARVLWAGLNRHTRGVPNEIWRPIRRTISAAHTAVTDPRRFARRLSESLGGAPSRRPH
jgi:MoaA/NifB/PqqE/SkfB family radical SAM enzyme